MNMYTQIFEQSLILLPDELSEFNVTVFICSFGFNVDVILASHWSRTMSLIKR